MNTYTNIGCFFLITIFYFIILKPKVTFNILTSDVLIKDYTKGNLIYLALYFLLVILLQFGLNSYSISSMCGGSVKENIGTAGFMTFVPWVIIFGTMLVVLIMFPSFKSAFSDVVGYYCVSSSASKLLNELLIDAEVYKEIEKSSEGDATKLEALKSTASLVTKLTGNMSLLINKIVPSNFVDFWNLLKPLMKDQYKEGENATQMRDKLLDLTYLRENIGEAMWYIYTGVVLISIVQYNITSRGCKTDLATMQKNYKNFQDEKEKTEKADSKSQNTIYTLTS